MNWYNALLIPIIYWSVWQVLSLRLAHNRYQWYPGYEPILYVGSQLGGLAFVSTTDLALRPIVENCQLWNKLRKMTNISKVLKNSVFKDFIFPLSNQPVRRNMVIALDDNNDSHFLLQWLENYWLARDWFIPSQVKSEKEIINIRFIKN